MKFSNVSIGMKVEVKQNPSGFFDSNAGLIGTVIRLDKGKSLDVLLEFDDGSDDWGHTSSIRKTKQQPLFDKQDVDQMTSESTEGVTPRTIVHHTDFKVGDKVLVSTHYWNGFDESFHGVEAVVSAIEDAGYEGDYSILIDHNGEYDWGNYEGLTLIEDGVVEETVKQQEVEVGSRVKVKNNQNSFYSSREGKVGTVIIATNGRVRVEFDGDNISNDSGYTSDLEIISDVSVEQNTKTPFTKLCEKVLQVSDMETLIKFVSTATTKRSDDLNIGSIDKVGGAFIWSGTPEGLEFWGDLDSKVKAL